MLDRPRIRGDVRLEVVGSDLLLVARELEHRLLEGRLLPLIVPLLQEGCSLVEIMDRLAGRATPLDVRFGLELLREEGLLDDGAVDSGPELAATGEVDRRGSELRVESIGSRARPLFGALATEFGIDPGALSPARVLLTDHYLNPDLLRELADSRSRGERALVVKTAGSLGWVGPLFGPGGSPCWRCLRCRLEEASGLSWLLEGSLYLPLPEREAVARAACRAALHTLREMAASPSRDTPPLGRTILVVDPVDGLVGEHRLARWPACPVCGVGEWRRTAPLELEARTEITWTDGGFRERSADETWSRCRDVVSPIVGPVKKVERARVDGSDLSIWIAEHPFRSAREGSRPVWERGSARAAGKGQTDSQARASAVCEAIERYCGCWRGVPVPSRATFIDVADRAIDPASLLNFSRGQLENRQLWNDLGLRNIWVPNAFDPAAAVDWSEAWSITERSWKLVPTGLCYYGHEDDHPVRFWLADSNGAAAGNSVAEAILQGLLELIERDAVAIWWYGMFRRPGLALGSLPGDLFRRIAASHAELGRKTFVLDVTHDLGIPVYAAVSLGGGLPLLGFGAHLDPWIAVARAVTEMSQFLPGLVAGALRPGISATPRAPSFLRPGAELSIPDPSPSGDGQTIEGALDQCIRELSSRGREVLFLDQSLPDLPLAVVRVFVPGLRHYWARLGPGRLYSVPVDLGWRAEVSLGEELNRAHILI